MFGLQIRGRLLVLAILLSRCSVGVLPGAASRASRRSLVLVQARRMRRNLKIYSDFHQMLTAKIQMKFE
jgi:hypothetical protein